VERKYKSLLEASVVRLITTNNTNITNNITNNTDNTTQQVSTTQTHTHKLPNSLTESSSIPTSYIAVSSTISGIILDMDGTLTQPGAIDFSAMYTRNGLEKTKDSDILAVIEALPTESERINAMKIILEEEKLGCDRMELRPHLHTFLHAARTNRVRLAITTRNCETSLDKFISLSNIHESVFFPRLTRDSLNGVNKPNPEVAQHIFRHWSVEPGFEGTVWFVGDSIDDMMCGRNSGCKTCLIRTPYNAHLTLTSFEERGSVVDLVVESLEEFARKVNLLV
jgi:HAD superfamily hydrolase (TIGR01549 family)